MAQKIVIQECKCPLDDANGESDDLCEICNSVDNVDAARPMSARKRRSRSAKAALGAPPMANLGFEGARHMHPERLPTRKRDRTVSVRLYDTQNDTVEHMQKYAETVKRLMIPGLKLKNVPDSLVDHLVVLEKLDLGNNKLGDTSLPESFKHLDTLVELNLSDNKFTKIPKGIQRLKSLSRLNLSKNSIDSLKGVEKLKRMRVLMLENNKLNSVFKEISHMKKLEILDCGNNAVREVGLEVRSLKSLKYLDISHNRISVLPTDIFRLPHLESLLSSHNQISKVPSFNRTAQNNNSLSEIDLSSNAISKFPGHLLFLTNKLDLSSNRIKALNLNVMKKLDWESEQELNLDDNPLTFPPSDICQSGLKSMIQFCKEAQADVKVYQGIKVLVLGSHGSGKTSFVQSLVDQQARLSQEMYETSAGIDVYDASFDYVDPEGINGNKQLQLTIWDFCGHPFYLFPHYVFFEQPAIAVLTFNVKKYKSDRFYDMVGSWFDWMISKTNKLVVLLVGTNCDKLSQEKIRSVCTEVKTKLSEHLQNQRDVIDRRIKIITDKSNISATLQAQLKAYMALLREKFTVQSEVIRTSSADFTGFKTVQNSIEKLAGDTKIFPNVLRVIPTFWLDVESYLEEKGNSMMVPVMKWEDYEREVTSRFGMKSLLKNITQYLHETGKVLWFSSYNKLKDFVFIRPSWLFDIYRNLFRHDMKTRLDVEIDDSFRSIGINQSKYDAMKEELLTEGVVDRDLLKCILSQTVPIDYDIDFQQVLGFIMKDFSLGYPVWRRLNDREYKLNVEPDSQGNVRISKILLPWFRKVDEPEGVRELWDPLAEKRRLAALVRFPRYMPPGLFELLSVRAHADVHKLKYLAHWGGGIHARHQEEKVQILIIYYRDPEGHGTTMRFELRDESDPKVDEVAASTMWSIVLPILMELEDLLSQFQGVLVERKMECPFCKQASFLGEWLTPKETQNMTERECEECGEGVDTSYLVQPREKKRGDISLIRRRIQSARKERAPQVAGPVLDTGESETTYDVLFKLSKTRRRRAALIHTAVMSGGIIDNVRSERRPTVTSENMSNMGSFSERRNSRRDSQDEDDVADFPLRRTTVNPMDLLALKMSMPVDDTGDIQEDPEAEKD